MNIIPFNRNYSIPEALGQLDADSDMPEDLSRLHKLYQAAYDAEELQDLTEMIFIVPRQIAANY